MTTLTLGSEPADLSVILNMDADFVATVRRDDGIDWDPGAPLRLCFTFGGTTPQVNWLPTLDGVDAKWDKDRLDVNAVASARPRKVQLWFDELLWATGTVTVNR